MLGADTDLPALLSSACGTGQESQYRYQQALTQAGYQVTAAAVDYAAEPGFGQLVGGVLSALPADRLPAADQRPGFAGQIRSAVGPGDRFAEPVHVAILTGRIS